MMLWHEQKSDAFVKDLVWKFMKHGDLELDQFAGKLCTVTSFLLLFLECERHSGSKETSGAWFLNVYACKMLPKSLSERWGGVHWSCWGVSQWWKAKQWGSSSTNEGGVTVWSAVYTKSVQTFQAHSVSFSCSCIRNTQCTTKQGSSRALTGLKCFEGR